MAEQLAQTIDAILKSPEVHEKWAALFAFPECCLAQPSEGGKRCRNLTTAVVRQTQRFKEEGVAVLEQGTATERGQRKRAPLSPDAVAAKRAAAKLDEGNVKGAICLLCSTDTIAEASTATLQQLLPKHPPAPADKRAPASIPWEPLLASVDHLSAAIRSFPPGSSGGPDGLRPQHLKDLTEKQVGGSLLASLTNLTNFILAGKVPEWVRPHFFGASLLAFCQEGWGSEANRGGGDAKEAGC